MCDVSIVNATFSLFFQVIHWLSRELLTLGYYCSGQYNSSVVTPVSDRFVCEGVGNVSWSVYNLIVNVVIVFSDCLWFSLILMFFVWNTDTHLPPSFPKYFPFSFRAFQNFGVFASYMSHLNFFQVIWGYIEIRVSLKTSDCFPCNIANDFKRNTPPPFFFFLKNKPPQNTPHQTSIIPTTLHYKLHKSKLSEFVLISLQYVEMDMSAAAFFFLDLKLSSFP